MKFFEKVDTEMWCKICKKKIQITHLKILRSPTGTYNGMSKLVIFQIYAKVLVIIVIIFRYVKEGEPQSRPGYNKGLTLILDAHTDKISSGSVSDDFRGFVATVNSGDEYPLTSQKGFLIRPGHQNYVILRALQVKSDPEIKDIKPNKRNCYFSDEQPLQMHKNYSQSNCILECYVEYARKSNEKKDNITGGCVPWFYPVEDEHVFRLCDPWQIKEFQETMKSIPDGHCDYCFADCTTTMYDSIY